MKLRSVLFGGLVAALILSYPSAEADGSQLLTKPTEPSQDVGLDDAEWRQRLLTVKEGSRWSVAAGLGDDLSALPGDRALRILESCWPDIAISARKQILKGFTPGFNRRPKINPHYFDVMHLGMTDHDRGVREFATAYINEITFNDFYGDTDEYKAWRDRTRHREPEDICIEECSRFMQRARALDQAQVPAAAKSLAAAANDFCAIQALREAILEESLLELIERWVSGGVDARALDSLVNVLANLHFRGHVEQAYLARIFGPLLSSEDGANFANAAGIATIFKGRWAVDGLVQRMTEALRSPGDASQVFSVAADALAQIGDPQAIPSLIAIIEADERYDLRKQAGRYIGGTALAHWAKDVDAPSEQDAAFWRNWWEQSRRRVEEPAASMDIPTISLDEQTVQLARVRLAGEAPAIMLVQESFADGNPDKHYFLIGPRPGQKQPANGYKLVLILPGGDGSADFHPWCKRIVENALPQGYVGVQLVAPVWTSDSDRRVWPIRQQHIDSVQFTTEDFIGKVVKEVRARIAINERYVFTLGWSSGGPPIYSMSLQPDSVITGTFVAMSVFKPEQLPSLDAAKGCAYYILHSPDDWIPFDKFPKVAERTLREHGARVKLQTYQGGHGWTDDPFGNIRRGIEWLEAQQLEP